MTKLIYHAKHTDGLVPVGKRDAPDTKVVVGDSISQSVVFQTYTQLMHAGLIDILRLVALKGLQQRKETLVPNPALYLYLLFLTEFQSSKNPK